MESPVYAFVLLFLGLVTLFLAVRGPKTRSREDTEVGLLSSLPEPAWRALYAIVGLVLVGLAVAALAA